MIAGLFELFETIDTESSLHSEQAISVVSTSSIKSSVSHLDMKKAFGQTVRDL